MRRVTLIVSFLMLAGIVGLALRPSASNAAPGGPKGNLSGVVVDQDGDLLAGATVQLYVDAPGVIDYVAEKITNASGQFLFKKLTPDDYSVVATRLTPSEACSGSTTATVTAGNTANVTVTATCQSL